MAIGAVAGHFSRSGQPSLETVERMLASAPHRGTSVATAAVGNSALGVIDDGATGFAHLGRHGEWSAAVLGPIDNRADLARELRLNGGEDEAQVVAAAFGRWGEGAAARLRGAFSGFVTDGQVGWAFRDHIGGRPFFYRDDGADWWGATEAKQVVAGAEITRRPNLDAITITYYRGVSDESALAGVQRLMYGSILNIGPSGSRASLHWDPQESSIESQPMSLEEAKEELATTLGRVIGRTVTGFDAVALSGGIDSPVVAAFAAAPHMQRAGRPLAAYTFIYPEHPSVDESGYTRLVADHLGITLSELAPTAGPLDDLDKWVRLADGPWDSLPMSVAAQGYRRAAEMGAKQVLTGTLAEYVYTVNPFILGHLASHLRLRALADQLAVRRRANRTWPSLVKQLVRELTPAPVGKAYARVRGRDSSYFPSWVDQTSQGVDRYDSALRDPVRRRWSLPTVQAARGTTTTSEAIEVCAASEGLTVRNPLADRDLWEFFLDLPVEIKFPDTVPKSLVRQTMRGRLPDAVLDRRDKTVFDENLLATVPWETMAAYMKNPVERIDGIDYRLLAERIDNRELHPLEVVWIYDLCGVQAFLETF